MTPQRQLVLDFIKAYMRLHGISPSYETIAKGLGLKGKGNIHRIIHRLQDDGHLTVTPHKFRSVKIRDKSIRDVASL